jgi:translation initiation factor 4B
LNLKPRTKPVEVKENAPPARSSIFGAAKPVDTYAREKEIEEKLKKKEDFDHTLPTSKRRDSESSDQGRKSGERYVGGENRRESGEGAAPVARRDSDHSRTSDDGGTSEDGAPSSSSGGKTTEPTPRLVPAPPPKENAWARKKEGGTLSSSSDTSNVSNNATASSPTSPTSYDKKDGQSSKPVAGGKGRGGGSVKSEATPLGKKPPIDKVNNSQNGPPAKYSDKKSRPPKDKTVPKSFEDMPKFEDTKSKDFSDRNKFAFLLDDENDGGDERGNDEGEPQDITS